MYEYTVNGKRVVFREKWSARNNWALPKLIQDFTTGASAGDFSGAVPILTRVIERWDFPGDPSKPESYDDLELVTEVIPLLGVLAEYIGKRLGNLAESKNSTGPSTSA